MRSLIRLQLFMGVAGSCSVKSDVKKVLDQKPLGNSAGCRLPWLPVVFLINTTRAAVNACFKRCDI